MRSRAGISRAAARRHELLKRGRALLRSGAPAAQAALLGVHEELERIARGTWEPPPGWRIADVVERILDHRQHGLVVTRVRLSPITRAELAEGEPVAELLGIECDPWDKDCDIIEARLPARAGRGRGRR